MNKDEFAEKFSALVDDVKEIKRRTEKIDDLATGFGDLKRENESLRERIKKLEEEKYETQKRMNVGEQYSRRNNVIITGFPKDSKEDLREKMTKLAEKLGVKLFEYDICTVHRLSNNGESPAIVMKMNNRDKKTQMMKEARKRKLKASDFRYSSSEDIFLSEHLTKENNELLIAAKEKLKMSGFVKFVWPCDGQVLIREHEGARIIKIEDFSHLLEITDAYGKEYQESEKVNEENYLGGESDDEVENGRDQGADENIARRREKKDIRSQDEERDARKKGTGGQRTLFQYAYQQQPYQQQLYQQQSAGNRKPSNEKRYPKRVRKTSTKTHNYH